MNALTCMGWIVAASLAFAVTRLRARLELVARAEHELRGPLTAFCLALDAARGTPAGRQLARVLDAEIARARVALADLSAAQRGQRAETRREPVRVDSLLRSSAAAWGVPVRSTAGLAVVRADRSRLAQALGNVMSNAVEHGAGDVEVSATRDADRLRIEVTNATRGRGLDIAAQAAADSGGSLSAVIGRKRASAVLELPLEL